MHGALKQIVEILIFLAIIVAAILFILPALSLAFQANIVINGGILGVLLIGIVLAFKNLYDLIMAERWTLWFRTVDENLNNPNAQISHDSMTLSHEDAAKSPRLIRPTATLLNQRLREVGHLQINSNGMRMILEGLSIRIDESRETLRYVVGLLVFLGLLGTFWGLMQTVQSVGGVIGGLSTTGDGAAAMSDSFQTLKEGLMTPLNGMGTAFSSSLFGLAGSLILGYCALRVSQAQNRFYQDYEEWLSNLTRLSGSMVGEGDTSGMGLAVSLLEQTADSIDRLQHFIGKSETQQSQLYASIADLNKRLGAMVDSQKIEHELMRKLAEGQLSTRQVLERISEQNMQSGAGHEQQQSLKAIEQAVELLVNELRIGRDGAVKQIREELRLVSRTISNSYGQVAASQQPTESQASGRVPPPLKAPPRAPSS
ncbi:MAG: flagellar export protein FliJ [Alphaproteobacteria bacterium]